MSERLTVHQHDGGSGEPVSVPHRMTHGDEFLRLMELRRRTEDRLDELVAILDPEWTHLPSSQLKHVAPGVFLFKGGRDV